MDKVETPKTAAALKAANATITDGVIHLPLSSVNSVLQAAALDGISVILEHMDIPTDKARLVILGKPSNEVRDIGDITSINELDFVDKPANSRCQ